mmetsp:Transcript_81/g.413  ORF Transcript_81/g.413 Transcript_81/m.413 type:complete len:235 (+) Transcript_81:2802-3506(+)
MSSMQCFTYGFISSSSSSLSSSPSSSPLLTSVSVTTSGVGSTDRALASRANTNSDSTASDHRPVSTARSNAAPASVRCDTPVRSRSDAATSSYPMRHSACSMSATYSVLLIVPLGPSHRLSSATAGCFDRSTRPASATASPTACPLPPGLTTARHSSAFAVTVPPGEFIGTFFGTFCGVEPALFSLPAASSFSPGVGSSRGFRLDAERAASLSSTLPGESFAPGPSSLTHSWDI